MNYINIDEANFLINQQTTPIIENLISCLYGAWIHYDKSTIAFKQEDREGGIAFDVYFLFRVFIDSLNAEGCTQRSLGVSKCANFLINTDEASKILDRVKFAEARRMISAFYATLERCHYQPSSHFDLSVAYRLLVKALDDPEKLSAARGPNFSDYWF